MSRLLSQARVLTVLVLAAPWVASLAHADDVRRVLVLQSYNYTFPATSQALDGARQRFFERSPYKIELDAEYLDLIRFSEPGHEQLVANFLRDRYAQRQPDVVMVMSGEGLPFVIKHRGEFAPGVPVVFVGIAREAYDLLQPPADVTGHLVDNETNFIEVLSLAERLQPNARRLFVVAGAGPTDRRWQAIAGKVLDSRAQKFETTYLFELPYDALLAEVSRIPSDAIVIALTVLRDGVGKPFVAAEVANTLASISKAPVYYPYVSAVGKGVVGGFSEPFDSMGRTAADIALQIFDGKDPSTIPPRTTPQNTHRVDYRALQRWGLSDGSLPTGTVVLNRPPSIWEQHRNAVLATLGAFVLQTLIVAALLIQRRRRQRAEALLKESEERMTFTASSVNIALWQVDPETDELWATEHCARLFGLPHDTRLTLDTLVAAVHPQDRDIALSALRNPHQSNRSEVHDVRILTQDEQARWIRIRARTSPGDRGVVSGIFVDLTERKVAENEAALQRQEVAHLMRVSVLGELSGAIAHEINQPLTAILSNAQTALYLLAKDSPDLAEVRDALNDIVHEDHRAATVIQRLRNLLKKGERSFEAVDMNELVTSTVGLLNSELISRRMSIKKELSSDLPTILGDPVQLQQILLNLVMNAMDAMDAVSAMPAPERLIAISTQSAPTGTVEVRVKDRGPGMRPEQQARLFEPFYTTKEHGLGLGLTICSTILQAHGGKLSLINDPAGGAVAVLTLPAQEMLVAAQ